MSTRDGSTPTTISGEGLGDPDGVNGTGSDVSDQFFRGLLTGVGPGGPSQLQLASVDVPSESYTEDLVPTSTGDGSLEQKNLAVLYNDDMYLSDDSAPLSSEQETLIRNNLGLDAVHNPDLREMFVTLNDVQFRQLPKSTFVNIVVDPGKDVLHVGDHVTGNVSIPAADSTWKVQVQSSDGGSVTGTGNSLHFDFVETTAGYITVSASAGPPLVGAPPAASYAAYSNSALVDVLPAGQQLSTWSAQAWAELHVNGIVPADPSIRNRRITELYTDIYNSGYDPANPKKLNPFQWFGIAAIVSHNAGSAMGVAFDYGFLAPPGSPNAQKVYKGLGDGNLAIVMDMLPQGLAYGSGGMAAINALKASGYLSKTQVRFWQQLNEGVVTDNPALIDAGVMGTALIEQTETLQRIMGQNPALWKSVSSSWDSGFFPIKSGMPGDPTTFASWCSQNPALTTLDPNFYFAANRYQWFVHAIYPAWKTFSASHSTLNINQILAGAFTNVED